MSLTNVSRVASSLTNAVKVAFGETWASITTTWALETRTWAAAGTLLVDTSRASSSMTNVSKPV